MSSIIHPGRGPLTQSMNASQIKSSLDAFTRSERSAKQLASELASICDKHSDATWDALSFLDQYHRRRLLPTALFLEIKKDLDSRAFRVDTSASDYEAETMTGARAMNANVLLTDADEATLPGSIALAKVSLPRALQSPLRQRQPQRLRPGVVLLDRYVLIEPTNKGGMNTVFKALDRQRSSLPEQDRYVAIKFLLDRLPTREVSTVALQHEFTQTQMLSHPNIINVFDVEVDDQRCFMVMEWLEGEWLNRVLERISPRRISVPHASALIREIGFALACAHDRGVVHADVQPSNVMLTDKGELRLMNFGQANVLRRVPWIWDDVGSSTECQAMNSIYSSPQCLQGMTADARDDIYGLACIAYELLAGKPPFEVNGAFGPNVEVPRTKEMTSKQWRAFQHALAWERRKRPSNVREWLAELDLRQTVEHLPRLRKI